MIPAALLLAAALPCPELLPAARQSFAAGRLPEARTLLTKALECPLGDGAPRLTAMLKAELASLELDLMNTGEAERLYREAIDLVEKAEGPESPALVEPLNGLGSLYFQLRRLDQADRYTRRALALIRGSSPAGRAQAARVLGNLAVTLQGRGKLDQASAHYTAALAMTEDPESVEAAFLYSNRGLLHWTIGRDAKATADLERAVAIWRQRLPANHPHIALGLGNLGRVRALGGEPRAAEPLLREAVTIAESSLGGSNGATGFLYAAWADALMRLKRTSEAEAAAARARHILIENPSAEWLSHRVDMRSLLASPDRNRLK